TSFYHCRELGTPHGCPFRSKTSGNVTAAGPIEILRDQERLRVGKDTNAEQHAKQQSWTDRLDCDQMERFLSARAASIERRKNAAACSRWVWHRQLGGEPWVC